WANGVDRSTPSPCFGSLSSPSCLYCLQMTSPGTYLEELSWAFSFSSQQPCVAASKDPCLRRHPRKNYCGWKRSWKPDETKGDPLRSGCNAYGSARVVRQVCLRVPRAFRPALEWGRPYQRR